YGIYGAVGLVLGFVEVGILSVFAERADLGVRAILMMLGGLIVLLAIASHLLTPRFSGEIEHPGEGFKLADLTRVFGSPVVAPAAVVSTVSVVRTYGITLLAGPAFGALATRVRSPSRVIIVASIVIAVALASLIAIPSGPVLVIVAAVIVVALGFLANGCYGI